MQVIARELNFSETTFVIAADDERARVRIFTPAEELPFAGHPTLGTAWVLAAGQGTYTLELAAGDVEVRLIDDLAWMTPPAVALGARVARDIAAAIVGLDEADLDPALEPRMIRCGPEFALVGVRSLEALRRVRVTSEMLARHALRSFPFAVCREAYSADADFAVRMHFFDGTGIREDPATGSAASAFAGWLASRGDTGRFVLEQGFEIGRPSRLYIDVGATNTVGGKVQLVARGDLVG
jgi:trans-2,3-dihydro-3-hydroxyanthranilate isomerase